MALNGVPNADQLYGELSTPLRQLVGSNIDVSTDVMDDACQHAWGRLLTCRAAVRPGSELPWLATTATREALRLLRAQRRTVSLSSASQELDGRLASCRSKSEPQQLAELRDRIGSVSRLPIRQQKIVWLHSFGYDYREISVATGASTRTVQRQLLGARRKLAS